ILPETCARTRWSFARATRNMVPGRTVVIVPSSSMAFSEFSMLILATPRTARPRTFRGPAVQSIPDLPAIAGKGTPPAIRTRTLCARTCFVNSQRSAVKFTAVERAHRGVGLCAIVHRDECKAARFASHPVHHQMDFVDRAMLFEQILK